MTDCRFSRLRKALTLLGLLLLFHSAGAQLRLSGSLCIAPGTDYFYTVNGKGGAPLPVTACLTGGVFAGTGATCLTSPAQALHIVWTEGAKASLTIHSAEGDTTLYPSRNGELAGGEISSPRKNQLFDLNRAALSITCSPAAGGACDARYAYQWQSSANCVEWTDIDGATTADLQLPIAPELSTFYRRRVYEKASNTIGYSDVATVFIVPVGLRSADVLTRR